MSFKEILCFVLVSYLGLSECSFVDTLVKCGINEYDCQAKGVQEFMHNIAETGVSELNIPSIDPIKLSNVNVSVAGLIDIILVKGVAKGVKNCIIKKYHTDIDKHVISVELICDITINGEYKLQSGSPVFKELFGGDLSGEGNCEIKVDQLKINLKLPFEVVQRDGEIFIILSKKYSYTVEVLGKVVFDADNLYVGKKESSKQVIPLVNENWKSVLNTVGTKVYEFAMKLVHKFLRRFCSNVSAKHYIKDDLTPYVKKE